jgi:dephospho-CoA kinase
MSVPVIDADNRKRFQQVMERRLPKLDKESQKKRVAKVLKKLTQ